MTLPALPGGAWPSPHARTQAAAQPSHGPALARPVGSAGRGVAWRCVARPAHGPAARPAACPGARWLPACLRVPPVPAQSGVGRGAPFWELDSSSGGPQPCLKVSHRNAHSRLIFVSRIRALWFEALCKMCALRGPRPVPALPRSPSPEFARGGPRPCRTGRSRARERQRRQAEWGFWTQLGQRDRLVPVRHAPPYPSHRPAYLRRLFGPLYVLTSSRDREGHSVALVRGTPGGRQS